MQIRTLLVSVSFALTCTLAAGATGCGGGDDASCGKVVDHTLKLMPKELAGQLGDKKDLVKQCEKKMSKEERTCALAAKSMEDMMKCRSGKKG